MIIADFETFKFDWLFYFLDTDKQQGYFIINDKEKLQKFYDQYKNEIMIFYNGSHFDKYILQGILAGFSAYDITQWIIRDGKQGWAYSKLLNKFPITIFDVMQPNKSLKQCEASLGMKIVESSVPFDIQRKLTKQELKQTLQYCKFDVFATMEVFLQDGFYLSPQDEFQSSISIIKEFNFPQWFMGKTKAQMGCAILNANKRTLDDDEFDISTPDNIILGKYEPIREWFLNPENHWYYKDVEGRKTDEKNELVYDVAGEPHTFGFGGVHFSKSREIIDGELLMCDFGSLYPNIMVNYNLVSRGVPNPNKYKELLETRLKLKAKGDSREKSYKIALNGSYGQMKYENSPLYDPRNANNVCIHGQLILVDLIDKLEQFGEICSSNTDGVLIRVHSKEDKLGVEKACREVSERLNIPIDIDEYTRFIVKDVNNYLAIRKNGKIDAKGSYVKYKSPLEYNYNIINHAIREYFINNIPVAETVMKCNDLREFQIIAKAGGKYKYAMLGDKVLPEKVNRVFASKNPNDKGIFKVHNETNTKAKIEMTPEHCFIINEDIMDMKIPNQHLDKNWYIELGERRVKEFVK